MSAERLAEQVGMSVSNVAKIERGDIRLKTDQLETFARALGVDRAEILSSGLALSPRQKALLDLFSTLPIEDQDRLLRIGRSLGELPEPTKIRS